jgi:hypothetical protein
MSYSVFTRTFWKRNPSWPNCKEPALGRKTYLDRSVATEEEARKICKEWNKNHDPGPMSRKAEFEEN